MPSRSFPLLALALVVLLPAPARADDDVQSAARAFQAAQQAQIRGDYSQAAELFELAYDAAPSPAALRSAIRNHLAAGELPRAATLSLVGLVRHASDSRTRTLAQQTLEELEPQLGRIVLRCSEPCVGSVDGILVATEAATERTFFVEPGTHRIGATWVGRPDVEQSTAVSAGASVELSAMAPPAAAEPELPMDPESEPSPDPGPTEASPEPSSGLHPWAFWTSLGVTTALAGVTIWAAIDLKNQLDDYESSPTEQGYDDGVRAQRVTYTLAWITGAGIVATTLLGLLWTDWSDGTETARYIPSVWASRRGGGVSLLHSF